MSIKLDNKLVAIKKAVDQYAALDECNKIDEAIKIEKNIQSCKRIIMSYQDMLDVSDVNLSDSPTENTEEVYKYNLEQLNNIKTIFETKDLTIDEKITLFLDYAKYSTNVKEYLEKKRDTVIKYI